MEISVKKRSKVDKNEVKGGMEKMKCSKTAGPRNIPADFWKRVSKGGSSSL